MASLGIELQTITQTVEVTSSSIIDLDIPEGTAVLSSGIQVNATITGGTCYMSADGPHPTDSTKWRFQPSVESQTGGTGYPINVTCWMIVATAATC